jgi:hypothetical protein
VVEGVEFCPNANGERASANPKASARDRSVLRLIVIEFELLIIVNGRRAAWSRPTVVEFDEELLIRVVCRSGKRFLEERRVDELEGWCFINLNLRIV